MKHLLISICLLSTASPVLAENQLTPLPPPPPRPYPYEVLGLQPGDSLDEVLSVLAERDPSKPNSERETLRVEAPDGAVFEFSYDVFVNIGAPGFPAILSNPMRDSLSATLMTDVMEKRPSIIGRTIVKPSSELPEPLAFKAQIEELYGKPSRFVNDGITMDMLYAWGEDGFIPTVSGDEYMSYDAHESRCLTSERRETAYRFKYPREGEIMPGCVAAFRLTYKGSAGKAEISYHLVDYDLVRRHEKELDRQILEGLKAEVAPSDMEL